MKNLYDVIVVGAGAAGLTAAATALKYNKRVAIFDLGSTPARKVRASGGGNCNITNDAVKYDKYHGKNQNFVRGALSRFTPDDVKHWASQHKLKLIQKTPGRYFCDNGADAVVAALMNDVRGADIFLNQHIDNITKQDNLFHLGKCVGRTVVIATGGISFPTLGVSDAGYKIAKSFGHKIVPLRPALGPLVITDWDAKLAGITVDAEIKIEKSVVRDSLLFTHSGIGGPAAYRASLYDIGNGITIDLAPNTDVFEQLKNAKQQNGKKSVSGILGEIIPDRLAKYAVQNDTRHIADIKDADLREIAKRVNEIRIPGNKIRHHGMSAAEVVRGGVDTDQISSKTMESKLCPGLFLAGEILDIAGDLGGFNLHWAWASGFVAGINAAAVAQEF